MTILNIEADSVSGGIYSDKPDYATARSTSDVPQPGYDFLRVGQYLDGAGKYSVSRSFMRFNTSSILPGTTINSVKLKMTCLNDYSIIRDFDVVIKKVDWSAQDPLTNATREAAWDACLAAAADTNIWRNTSGMSENTPYTSGELDTTWLNLGGYTYYGLMSSRDVANSAPGLGSEFIFPASGIHATASYRCILIVDYTPTKIKSVCGILRAAIKKISGIDIAACKKIGSVDNT